MWLPLFKESARTSSTTDPYSYKWRAFKHWPHFFSVEIFFVWMFSACHIGIDKLLPGAHLLAVLFLKGVRRWKPISRSSVPSWDLPTVLDALCGSPFEPLVWGHKVLILQDCSSHFGFSMCLIFRAYLYILCAPRLDLVTQRWLSMYLRSCLIGLIGLWLLPYLTSFTFSPSGRRVHIFPAPRSLSRDLLFVSFSNLVWFVRFYRLDVVAPSVASSILSTRLVEC